MSVILSQNTIERISRGILRQYLAAIDVPPSKIDPKDLGERLYGVRFLYFDLGRRQNALGITAAGNCEIKIWSNTGDCSTIAMDNRTALIDTCLLCAGQEGRLHFTMMHEIAHIILSDMFPDPLGEQPLLYRLSSEPHSGEITDWGEWQANILTSYLLMPKELVLQHMKRVGLEHGIHRLNRKFAPREYSLFSDVADSLGVSKTALFIRLKKLGLIENENFFNPYDLVTVYPDSDENF